MKTLLISPPYPLFGGETKFASPPLGLAYIAAVLEEAGEEVDVLDCVVEDYDNEYVNDRGLLIYGLDTDAILERIAAYKPDIIGISCLFSTVDLTVNDLADTIREIHPSIKIVLGGTHATVMAEDLVRRDSIDFVVIGEGEQAFLELVEHLSGKRDLEDVNNLTWFKGDEIQSTPQRFIDDIDKLPLPARHLLDMEGYMRIGRMQGVTRPGLRATTLITSRGCPADCVFCSIHTVWGKAYRGHSPEYVMRELIELKEKYKIEHVLFEDDNLTFDRARAATIFDAMVEKKLNMSWTTPNGVAMWVLNAELLAKMKRAGCHQLFLAFESGVSDTLVHIVKKPLRLDKAQEIATECRKLGIRTQAFFVLGFPGETKDLMQQSMKFAENLDVDQISVAVATPYPGTPLYADCVEKGYIDPKNFEVGKLMTRVGHIETPEFTPHDVESLIAKTYVRFALKHPYRSLRRLAGRFVVDPLQTVSFVYNRFADLLRLRSGREDAYRDRNMGVAK